MLIPGNHDEVLKDFTNFSFGEISIKNEDTHQLADGRKVLITHGDEFDAVIINARWDIMGALGQCADVLRKVKEDQSLWSAIERAQE